MLVHNTLRHPQFPWVTERWTRRCLVSMSFEVTSQACKPGGCTADIALFPPLLKAERRRTAHLETARGDALIE